MLNQFARIAEALGVAPHVLLQETDDVVRALKRRRIRIVPDFQPSTLTAPEIGAVIKMFGPQQQRLDQ